MFFCFNDTASTDLYTLSLHDALPISDVGGHACVGSGVFLGLGSIVGHRVRIAPWVRVGVQSAVIKDITEPGIVVIGVPAKKRRAAEYPPGWLE